MTVTQLIKKLKKFDGVVKAATLEDDDVFEIKDINFAGFTDDGKEIVLIFLKKEEQK